MPCRTAGCEACVDATTIHESKQLQNEQGRRPECADLLDFPHPDPRGRILCSITLYREAR
jgi:hypothetical protein